MIGEIDLAGMVERALRAHGPQVAVVDGPRRATFQQLEARTAQLANALSELGSSQNSVAVLLPNCLEFVEVDVAALRAGLAKVPINPRLAPDERAYILADSEASVLVTDSAHEEWARERLGSSSSLRSLVVVDGNGADGYEKVLGAGASSWRHPPRGLDDPSVILYTSGTTGRPKGATWTLKSRTASTVNMLVSELDAAEGDAMLHAGPLTHGSGSKVMAFLIRGARNVIMPRFDGEAFLDLVERERITSTFLVPTMIAAIVDAAPARADLDSLRAVSYGGAPISESLLLRAMDTFGPIFIQVYGSCEAPHPVTVLSRADHQRAMEQRDLMASAGKPSLLATVSILGEDGAPASAGEVGEIAIGGPIVMRGYWNDPAATADQLDDGVYLSGDVGRLDDAGYLFLVDRKRELIISGGYNVYPAEVERVLSAYPAVEDVAVVGAPDETWGERVVAYVVPRAGSTASADELTEHCRTSLAGYKKPREYVFVDDLPKGSTGKILKDRIRALRRVDPQN